jgi:hypothetical protein
MSVFDVWFATLARHIFTIPSLLSGGSVTKYSRTGRVSALSHRFKMEGLLSV